MGQVPEKQALIRNQIFKVIADFVLISSIHVEERWGVKEQIQTKNIASIIDLNI